MADKRNGLELLGAEIDKEIQEDIARLESIDVEIPQELHEKMLAFARELDKKRIAKEKKKRRQRMMQTAAVFAAVLIGGNFIALETSEAYRARFMSLFKDDISVTIRTEDEYDLIGDWEDYWYPATLPETFVLQGAEKNGDESIMLFVDEVNDVELRVREFPIDAEFSFDHEHFEILEVKIGTNDGYAFYDESSASCSAIWMTDKNVILLDLRGEYSIEKILKIAENMIFVSK
ncbi:MAG: DUF4367 domain-containing protein [Firmicutes bacterium]|nr:DUF4367 domain-containing protein [Bacillota bacterium]